MLKIALVSKDDQLHRLCREILFERLGSAWDLEFHADGNGNSGSGVDLTIWDLNANGPEPGHLHAPDGRSSLFLVNRNDLGAFRERFLSPQARILLKPATHATLSALLEQCISEIPQSGLSHNRPVTALRTDRDDILQSLIKSNLRLQEYDQDRTAFLTRAMHDFRAPLTSLLGYCSLILDGQFGPLGDAQKEVLDCIQHSAKRLSRMSSAMFHLGVGPQADDGAPLLVAGDIHDCVQQAQQELAYLIAGKSLSVSVHVTPPEGLLLFDTGKLEQVFVNLLDNACRFTPKGGSIQISGYPFFWERRMPGVGSRFVTDRRKVEIRSPNSFRVNIRDTGPGIPSQLVGGIFKEYASYNGGTDRSGGGLGLAICRLLIRQHDGHIWGESCDTGAIFSFVLPLKADLAFKGVNGGDNR